jgi:hypothetical protein
MNSVTEGEGVETTIEEQIKLGNPKKIEKSCSVAREGERTSFVRRFPGFARSSS